ncbi:hypothetical protein VDT1_0876 [Vibrio sp. 16]|nr:hypothetical protein VPMS16_4080 [Vibrio sp. 16]CAK4067979.1 hypothetical protein VDT1_0876 [Vibrio sp. 16]
MHQKIAPLSGATIPLMVHFLTQFAHSNRHLQLESFNYFNKFNH